MNEDKPPVGVYVHTFGDFEDLDETTGGAMIGSFPGKTFDELKDLDETTGGAPIGSMPISDGVKASDYDDKVRRTFPCQECHNGNEPTPLEYAGEVLSIRFEDLMDMVLAPSDPGAGEYLFGQGWETGMEGYEVNTMPTVLAQPGQTKSWLLGYVAAIYAQNNNWASAICTEKEVGNHTVTKPCTDCAVEQGMSPANTPPDEIPQRKVVEEFTTNKKFDPTQAYKLECGHSTIDL